MPSVKEYRIPMPLRMSFYFKDSVKYKKFYNLIMVCYAILQISTQKKPGGISDRSTLYDTEEISAGIDW